MIYEDRCTTTCDPGRMEPKEPTITVKDALTDLRLKANSILELSYLIKDAVCGTECGNDGQTISPTDSSLAGAIRGCGGILNEAEINLVNVVKALGCK